MTPRPRFTAKSEAARVMTSLPELGAVERVEEPFAAAQIIGDLVRFGQYRRILPAPRQTLGTPPNGK